MVYHPNLSVMDNIGYYISQFCLSWTIMVGISPIFVCLGQFRCVYDPVLSIVDNIGWYITWFCLLWAVMVGIVPDFVCLG